MKNLLLSLSIVGLLGIGTIIAEKCPEHDGFTLTFTGKTKVGTSGKLLKQYSCPWGEKYWIVSK